MAHQTISVYFPDEELLKTVNEQLPANSSISAFIVQAVQEKVQTLNVNGNGDQHNNGTDLRQHCNNSAAN